MPDYYTQQAKNNQKDLDNQFAPYGDVSRYFVENAILIPSGVSRAVNDRDRIVKLQNGIVVLEIDLIVTDGVGAASTVDIGTRQIASPKSNNALDQVREDWTDDRDYFFDGVSVQTANRISNSLSSRAHKPLYVNRGEVWLEVTWQSAVSNAQTIAADLHITYRTKGQP